MVFKVAQDNENVVAPPDQVFNKPDFDFLITIGGGIIEDESQYKKLINLLKTFGETEFYILENIGATLTDRFVPFQATIPIDLNVDEFEEIFTSFDPPFGWMINHFFVFGKNDNWGIYICEHPTINIIGCNKEFSKEFRNVFSIKDNGYKELEDFIDQEFHSNIDMKKQFIKEYRLGH